MANVFWAEATPTITAGAYAAGDAIGGLITLGVGGSLPSGVLQYVGLVDKAKQSGVIDVVFFNATFTATADNAAFDPTDADLAAAWLATVAITAADYSNYNDNGTASVSAGGVPFVTAGALYVQLVARGAPTYTSTTDLLLKIGILLG